MKDKAYKRLSNRILFTSLFLLFLSGASAVVHAQPPLKIAEPAKPVHLKVGTMPFLVNSIVQIAKSEGFFAEQGIEVEVITFRSSNDLIPLLLQGELDAATPILNAGFFNAVASAGKLKMALPLTTLTVKKCSSYALIARKADVTGKTLTTPGQWKGVQFGFPLVGGQQNVAGYSIDTFLNKAGLGLADIEASIVAPPVQAEALLAGQIDIAFAIEPWVTRLTDNDRLALLQSVETIVPDLTYSMIAYGEKLLDNPDLGNRFAIAMLKAIRQYRQGNTPRNVEIAAAHTGLDPNLISRLCWSDSPPDGYINKDSIMDYQAWLQKQKLLDRVLLPAEFLDTSFSEAANRVLGADVK